MYFVLIIGAWVVGSLARLREALLFVVYVAWVSIVRAAIALIEVVDEWFPDAEVRDKPLLRVLVMGFVGFQIVTWLTLFSFMIAGDWSVLLFFLVGVGFCAFVGLVADPDQDWSLNGLPGSSWRGGPRTPLNL